MCRRWACNLDTVRIPYGSVLVCQSASARCENKPKTACADDPEHMGEEAAVLFTHLAIAYKSQVKSAFSETPDTVCLPYSVRGSSGRKQLAEGFAHVHAGWVKVHVDNRGD